MIDLAALTSLRAVDLNGSVVGAADALGFTPSAVSQQVKRLERQTGVELLERVGRGVEPEDLPQDRLTMLPSLSMSTMCAAGVVPRPGIVRMSPQIG